MGLTLVAVLLIVCLSGVSAADQLKGGDTTRTLMDVLAYDEEQEGEYGHSRNLAACFASASASASASDYDAVYDAVYEAAYEATSEVDYAKEYAEIYRRLFWKHRMH